MTVFHLAQVNIARMRAPLDHPQMAAFVAALEPVNALADQSPGFVWRLQDEAGDATALRPFEDPAMMINMSLWESLEALAAFVYRQGDHRAIMRRRAEFFTRPEVFMALWWVPGGQRPTPADALERLEVLRRLGPSPAAFTFVRPFPSPDGREAAPVLDECA
jgi:heme-degrading monooxygenase HmoA